MPAGATASFEALLDSLNEPPSSPAPAPPGSGSGSPSSRLSRAPMSPHSEPPAPHAAKADDDLLDHLLESLDIGSAPPAAAPARASTAYQQPAGNPRASLSQPGRATSAQPTNPRASVRQEAATAFAGVEDSLDSLLAALDGSSSGNSSPAVAPRTTASPSNYSAPQASAGGEEADFDSLLAQLSGEQPAPARNVPAASSRRQPQPDMATLRPSFAETYVPTFLDGGECVKSY